MKQSILLIIFFTVGFILLPGMVSQTTTITVSPDPAFNNNMDQNASMDIALATAEARAAFDIQRIELYFENMRADITIQRDYSDLKAFADIKFAGSGLLQGYWEVDGRILSHVNQHLVFRQSITLQTPQIPPLPTFDTGTHIVKFVITNPSKGVILPSILYFVTAGEFKGSPIVIKLISPADKSLLEYASVKFEWEKLNTKSTYIIQFYENPESKPVFSLCINDSSFDLPESVLKRIFSPGRKYYWKVKGCGAGDSIGESQIREFTFKKPGA